MCQPGNQTIYAECRDRIQHKLGGRATNADMRQVLVDNGGCMQTPPQTERLDRPRERVVVSH